ncbi:MAG TPA: LUD domain-containing protein [Anaerolineales bacterium]|nr:LUD domain-containing protein [Anaerolineales bacterium]
MAAVPTDMTLIPNREFAKLAGDAQIQRAAKALEANGMHTLIAENGEEAKKVVLGLVPEKAEVYTNQSKTLEKLGLFDEFDRSGRYDAVRPKVMSLDRKTQSNEIRKLRTIPDYIVGSVHAITEDGKVLVSSFGGSQLAPYASGAAKVIWVVGAQKLVRDLNEAFRRIEEYSYPLEDARLLGALGIHSAIGKTLIVNREVVPNRITIVLVKEELGF